MAASKTPPPTTETPAEASARLVVRRTPGWWTCRIKGREIAGGELAPEISIAEAETRPDFEVVPAEELQKEHE